jgi:hypothetical protein
MTTHGRTATRPVSALRLATGLTLAATLTLSACGKDDPAGPGQTTPLVLIGVVNGSSADLSGSISLRIDNVSATGTFKRVRPTAATIALTGTYNVSSRALVVSGGGYSFSGTYDGSSLLVGSFTGPSSASGSFRAQKSTSNAPKAYCGTFNAFDPADEDGIWNFSIDGTSISGTATEFGGDVIVLSGTASGTNNRDLVIRDVANPDPNARATGQISADGLTVSGTYGVGNVVVGDWEGDLCS